MTTPNIYSGKYASPPLPAHCAPRNELIAQLDSAAECRLVFIHAPAGSGKTVSANLWAKNSHRKTVWIGLDAFDNSTAVFYRMFCTAILSAQPDNERMNSVLRDPAFNSSPIEHAICFLLEFITDDNENALILDDFHTITNNEILKSLPFILRRMPDSFVTIILSRTELNTHFDDFIERGRVKTVTAKNLEFGKDEIKEYFSLLDHQITKSDARTIYNYTNGWAIGINALAQSSEPISKLREQGGQVLANYIEKYLWHNWDESLRDFMLKSAILDEMPIGLCCKITGKAESEKILEQLQMRNAFVSRIDEGVYRFHHLFLDFLREQPEYIKANKRKSLNTAVEYYSSIGDDISSQRYAYESGNTKTILKMLLSAMFNESYHLEEFLDIARDFFISPSMESLCEKSPVLYALRAYVSTVVGNAELCIDSVEKLKHNIPNIIMKYPQYAELAFACSALDFRVNFLDLAEKSSKLPPFLFSSRRIKIGFLTLQMPFLHRINRDYRELSDPNVWEKVKNNYGRLYKDHYEAMYLCKAGGFLLEKNQLNEALSMAKDAMTLINPNMAREMRFAIHSHLSAVFLALNQSDELFSNIRMTREFVDSEAQYLRPNFLAFTTRIKLWDGDTAAANEWLAQYFVNNGNTLELYKTYQYFTTVSAYAVLGELEKAKDLSLRLKQLGNDFHRLQDSTEADTILSAILWAMGKRDEAVKILENVLSELQPYEFVRLVADEGAAVLPALKKISAKCERDDYKGDLIPMYVKSVYLAAYAVSKQRRGILASLKSKPIKLSKQQKLVIELLAQGHNRESVMNKTGMALGTYKTHIRLAYEKLEVNNINDAILKAKDLKIIE